MYVMYIKIFINLAFCNKLKFFYKTLTYKKFSKIKLNLRVKNFLKKD